MATQLKYMPVKEFVDKLWYKREKDFSNIRLDDYVDLDKVLPSCDPDTENRLISSEDSPLILNGSSLIGLRSGSTTYLQYLQARGTVLHRAHITNADFAHSNFKEADFSFAYLLGIYLRHADLRGVNFRGAHLHSADFSFSKFGYSHPRNTDFSEANLVKARIVGVEGLEEALLNQAFFRSTEVDPKAQDILKNIQQERRFKVVKE